MKSRKQRYTFGLLIDWIVGWEETDYYQSLIVSGLADFAKEHDINIMCFVTGRVASPNEWERSRNLLFDFVDSNKIDGLIIPTPSIGLYSNPGAVLDYISACRDIPTVTIGEYHPGYHAVTIDNYQSMKSLVDHLVEDHQYKRIAFVTGSACKESNYRYQAYCDSLKNHGIAYDPQLVLKGNFLFEAGAAAVQTLRENKIPFDALVCANDNMAMGALIEFNQHKTDMSEFIPITGFDDFETGRLFGLTSIRQPLYDETKLAADMLLKILEGQETPMHLEIPSEVVKRTSCGCISPMVRHADAHPCTCQTAVSSDSVKEQLLENFRNLNKTFGYSNHPEFPAELLGYEEGLINTFYEEFTGRGRDQFIHAWNSLLLWAIHKRVNFSFSMEILSTLRNHIIASLSGTEDIVRAENLFHAARIHLFNHLTLSGRNYFNPLQNESSDFLGEELMTSLDYNSQMKSMCQVLPRFGIDTCYIALFEDQKNPLDRSRLILGLNKKECYNKGSSGLVFKTINLLPEFFLHELYKERFNIIVQVLYQGDNRLGYVILSFDNGINKNYELIRYRLSVSLKATILIDRITKQATSLEKQVIGRTRELSESNRSLMEEVMKRKAVEDQLKKALKELGYYNEQLHMQSMRDDLTQLYNRRGFMKLGAECYENAKGNYLSLLLLYVDLDGLKRINDQHGHNEGDFAISEAAEILNKTFRNSDIICRLGGDEFTILMEGASPKDEFEIRKRIQHYCDIHNKKNNKPYQISMSMGAAFFSPDSNQTFEDLMKLADIALYEDKQRKRGQQEAATTTE